MTTRIIAGGAWVRLLIDGKSLGLVSGVSYDEDFGVVPIKVISVQGPIDYDSQDYSCRLNIQAYVPEPSAASPWPDGGTRTLKDYIPTRSDLQASAGKPSMFNVVQLVSLVDGSILNQFEQVLVASNGQQVAPNTLVTANVQMFAVERTI